MATEAVSGQQGEPTNSLARGYKIVCDPVHGMIPLDKLAVKIIDTHYFQRLRYIKQLSCVDYVYPGATHTRFSHSIGAYHLACKLIERIKVNNHDKADKMTMTDETCVRVAALCRGIGHGPFGHAYTRIGEKIADMKTKPVDISAKLTEMMLRDEQYNLKRELEIGVDLDECIHLIKCLITGKPDGDILERYRKKKYILQIVTNSEDGIKIGEWDYYNRDAMACGVSEKFQYDRALSMARVVETEDTNEFVLGYRDYDAYFLYNMFHTRFTLYQKVYKHRVVVAVELMIQDVFKIVVDESKARQSQKSGGGHIDLFPIKTIEDLEDEEKCKKFVDLNDNIIFKIRDEYEKARVLIQNIQERKVYKMIKDISITSQDTVATQTEEFQDTVATQTKESQDTVATQTKESQDTVATQTKESQDTVATQTEESQDTVATQTEESQNEVDSKIKEAKDRVKYVLRKLKMENRAEVVDVIFNYGCNSEDPVRKLYFYSKEADGKGKRLEQGIPCVRPSAFEERSLRVYYAPDEKDASETIEDVKKRFNKLWDEQNKGKK